MEIKTIPATLELLDKIRKNTQEAYKKICERIVDNYDILEDDPVLGPTNLNDPISTIVAAERVIVTKPSGNMPCLRLTFYDDEMYLVDSIALTQFLKTDDFKITNNFDRPDEPNKEIVVSIPPQYVATLRARKK